MAILVLALAGCALNAETVAQVTATRPPAVDPRCTAPPDAAGSATGFHRSSTALAARFGSPRHRGIDLIAAESDPIQTISGKLAYGAADADAEHEPVEIYACVDGAWQGVGATRTDRGGRFTVTLSGSQRLPPGLRALYGIVPADRSGFSFLAYVAKPGEAVIVTDLDGTVTASENAVFNTFLFGDDIGHRIGAPEALAASGHVVVYLSSRGDQLTGLTRRWLDAHGFPPGPIRHAKSAMIKPGPKTVRFKADAMKSFGVPIWAGIGNRASDVEAYRAAGVKAERIFVKLPDFEDELAGELTAGRAIGFTDYRAIAPRLR